MTKPPGPTRGACLCDAANALDNPFADPVPIRLAPDTLPDLPFSVHHNNLNQHGIHQIQNLVLDELARDHVSLSCAIVMPLRILGGAGSMVRPIAVGRRVADGRVYGRYFAEKRPCRRETCGTP